MFLLFFQILGSFVFILFWWQLSFLTLHCTYVYVSSTRSISDWSWLVWRKNLYFNTQIRVYHILFTDGATGYVAAKILMGQTLFYCKVFSELVHSFHSLLVCVSSFNWFDLYLTLEVFLGPCIQPGHCS